MDAKDNALKLSRHPFSYEVSGTDKSVPSCSNIGLIHTHKQKRYPGRGRDTVEKEGGWVVKREGGGKKVEKQPRATGVG